MSKISIITINYNNCIGLEKTIKSVLNLSSIDFEFIIIDGNSSDGSKKIINKYKDKFYYCISEKDSGIYNAMNKGIKVANGDYLIFMNSGDVFIDDIYILNKLLAQLVEPVIYYSPIYLSENDKIKEKKEYPRIMDKKFLFTRTICQQAIIYHKSIFKLSYFDEKLKYVSDWKMNFFLFTKKINFVYLETPFAIYDFTGITSQGTTLVEAQDEKLKVQLSNWVYYYFTYKTNKFEAVKTIFKVVFNFFKQ